MDGREQRSHKEHALDAEPEEESLDLPFTLTQASSLYILAVNGEEFFKRKIQELSSRLLRAKDEEEKEELKEGLSIINEVLSDTLSFKKEARQIILELEKPEQEAPKTKIITDLRNVNNSNIREDKNNPKARN